jgi:hypothetical protein
MVRFVRPGRVLSAHAAKKLLGRSRLKALHEQRLKPTPANAIGDNRSDG